MKQKAIAAFILLAILSPSFSLVPNLPELRGEDFILMAILLCFCFASPISRSVALIPANPVTRAFIFMGCLAIISICGATLFFDSELIVNDWMILPMLFRYWLIFRIAQSLGDYRSRYLCLGALLVAVLLSSIVGILQHYNMLGINNWLTPLYAKGAMANISLRMVIDGDVGSRIGGTNGDPRHYGYLLVIGLGLCFSLLLQCPAWRWRKAVVVTLGSILVAIAYTLSRSTILSGVFVVSIALLLHMQTAKNASRALTTLMLLLALGSVLSFAYRTQGFEERVMDTHTDSYDSSLNARTRDLMVPFFDAYQNPVIWLIGRGPAKAEMRTCAHNDFGWYFHRFGLPGLLFYILLLYWGATRSITGYKVASSPLEKAICMASLLVMANWALFAMAESIFKDTQLMAVNMFFLGLVYAVPAQFAEAKQPQANQPVRFSPDTGGSQCLPFIAVGAVDER